MIIAITGASGVGKTTALKTISPQLPKDIRVFHFDDIGIPDWSTVKDHKQWQIEHTHKWIDKLVDLARTEQVDILFEGSSAIEFYQAAFAKNKYTDYTIVLFDCRPDTMQQRLTARGQSDLYHEDMLNWLRHLRAKAQQNKIEIINTDDFSPQEIGQMIVDKVEKKA